MRPAPWIAVVALPLAGCAGVQSALDPAGDEAATIGDIWHLMLGVCGFMFALTMLFLAWAIVRGRRAREADAEARHEPALSLALHGWIALVVAGLAVLAIASFLVDRRLLAPATDVLRVRVTGMQWWWRVEYPSDDPGRTLVTANELHLPVDRTSEIELRTEDVIHSLWIPNLAGKLDLVPGRVNTLRVTPRRIGGFRGQCAEFCGLDHAWMALDVRVESADAFEAWRQRHLAPAKPPLSAGEREGAQLFVQKPCVMCHAIRGSDAAASTGPDLTHFASRATLGAGARPLTREALAVWLADPNRIKPGVHMPAVPMTAAERDRLVDYLMSLE